MKIGIVGSEAAKFTDLGEERAKEMIALICDGVDEVCSGECHLGGIDIWARQHCEDIGKPFTPFAPKSLKWDGGYKQRNLQIATWSDIIYCITVDVLPDGYNGMVFKECYHCRKAGKDLNHIKSGGCWTAIQAEKMGKKAKWIVIQNNK